MTALVYTKLYLNNRFYLYYLYYSFIVILYKSLSLFYYKER